MDKQEARQAMENGHIISHTYFSDDEYIYMNNGSIYTEEGYNFGKEFLANQDFMKDGWHIRNDSVRIREEIDKKMKNNKPKFNHLFNNNF